MFELKLEVSADYAWPAVPVSAEVHLAEGVSPDVLTLEDENSGDVVACQWEEKGGKALLTWVLAPADASRKAAYRLLARESISALASGAEVVDSVPEQLGFLVGGKPFTTYNFGSGLARPFFHPVLSPSGRRVTRNYPMLDVPGETRDHVHHRSLWTAHGDVNGVDCWSEEPGHGWIKHQEFLSVQSGPVFGGFEEKLLWTAPDGEKPVVAELREARIYALPDGPRIMDIKVTFQALFGSVKFGDTKEGGIVSVRVATPMDGDKGGVILTSKGGRGEAQCWGKKAEWCSYSGIVEGKPVGIAILDHPDNPRHPTYWHVRDYGLMTANPFGVSHFEHNPALDGGLVLPNGAELSFKYRILIYEGDAESAGLAAHYSAYRKPPEVKIVS
jgi:hypothetical protein